LAHYRFTGFDDCIQHAASLVRSIFQGKHTVAIPLNPGTQYNQIGFMDLLAKNSVAALLNFKRWVDLLRGGFF
jgi:hypothetical protein